MTRALRLVEARSRARAKPRSASARICALDGRAFGQRKVRQARLAELERQRAAPGDLHGVVQRLRDVGKELAPSPPGVRRYCAARVPCARGWDRRAARHRRCRRAPRAIRNRCAARKRTSLVATTGMPVFWLSATVLATQRLVVRAPQALQFEVVTIAEQRLPVARQRQRLGVAAIGERRGPRRLPRTPDSAISPAVVLASSQLRSSSGTPRSWPSSQARVTRSATFW